MYLAQYKSLNKKQFCEMNEVNEQKLFFVMIYDVLNILFKWAVTNVIYTTAISKCDSKLRPEGRSRGKKCPILIFSICYRAGISEQDAKNGMLI